MGLRDAEARQSKARTGIPSDRVWIAVVHHHDSRRVGETVEVGRRATGLGKEAYGRAWRLARSIL